MDELTVRVARSLVSAWSKAGGDVFGDINNVRNIKVDFLLLAEAAVKEMERYGERSKPE